jgi:hypothetical protein
MDPRLDRKHSSLELRMYPENCECIRNMTWAQRLFRFCYESRTPDGSPVGAFEIGSPTCIFPVIPYNAHSFDAVNLIHQTPGAEQVT